MPVAFCRLEQIHLSIQPRPPELRCVPHTLVLVQAEPFARLLESHPEQVGKLSAAAHAAAKLRIVFASATHLSHAAHDMFCLERIVMHQPVFEKVFDLVWQTLQYIPG